MYMRALFISGMLMLGLVANVNAAAPVPRRGGASNTDVAATTNGGVAPARSAVRSVARSATQTPKAVSARSAVTPTTSGSGVVARAAITQKVINSGTKVTAAVKNTAVNEECQNKYYGCMDAFCMLDNTSGGRCVCSNRNAELDEILAEIEKLDQQSYQMATYGVEKIEMGADADAAIARAKAVADESIESVNKSNRKKLDLSLWNTDLSVDDDDMFSVFEDGEDASLEGKTGDSLQIAAHNLCVAQIPECATDMQMLKLLYAQKIKSDCNAYENSLKQQKNASQTKLSTAERALRDAALEQLRIANKYDLGQCTIEFKKCMQTTGGCGDDFSSCTMVAASDNTNVTKSTSRKVKNYAIKGSATTIEISASTYDTLLAKKPLCETVTKSCVAVADQVWDTFLKEIAPTVKAAELIAEDNLRQNCIGNISQCFQKACKDNIDPNNPDGSYDMCLTRPETMLNVCKIPLNACGIDSASASTAKKSQIWDFVVARLASMRVDSCTREVKACLQSEDRCGPDYTQCIGLDFNSIVEMCPTDKLVGCQENGVRKSLADVSDIVMGVFLNIDNAMLKQCQKAVSTKMLEICGDTETCTAFDEDNEIGTESLLSYKDASGDYIIEGLVSFGNMKIKKIDNNAINKDDVKFGTYELDIDDYMDHTTDTAAAKARIKSAIESVENKINQKIAILSQDSTINMCVYGRNMSQIRRSSDNNRESTDDKTTPRFPNLLDSSVLAIVNSGMERANTNYTKKYNKLVGEALESQNDDVKSVLCAAMAASSPICTAYGTGSNGESVCTKYEVNKFDDVFAASNASATTNSSGNTYATRYIISGVNISKLTEVQQKGHSEYVQTDSFGNMLGRVATSAVYSPSTNLCTLTTESTMCRNAESAITTNESKTCGGGGLISFGTRCEGMNWFGGSSRKTITTQEYHGTTCTEFGEPVVTVNKVEM